MNIEKCLVVPDNKGYICLGVINNTTNDYEFKAGVILGCLDPVAQLEEVRGSIDMVPDDDNYAIYFIASQACVRRELGSQEKESAVHIQ